MNKILETSNVTTTHPSFPLPQMHHQVALTQFARFSSPWFHPNPTNFVTSVQPFLPSSPMTLHPRKIIPQKHKPTIATTTNLHSPTMKH